MAYTGPMEYIGKIPPRTDVEVIPLTKEEIEKQISDYKNFENQYNNDPEFKARIDAECKQWKIEFEEYKEADLKHRRECWARGEFTTLLELGVGFLKPYPYPHNPEKNMFVGWENVEVKMIGFEKEK